MTGQEHYLEAEKLLEQARSQSGEYVNVVITRAQVHATLALASVTAAPGDREGSYSHGQYGIS